MIRFGQNGFVTYGEEIALKAKADASSLEVSLDWEA